jgi:cell division septal protein FtsQ
VNRNKAFLLLAGPILMLSGSYIFASHSPCFNVLEIKVKGNNKITSGEIMERTESCMGANIFRLNPEEIEEKLKGDIRIKDVQVRRRLPRCILVQLEEKVPVLWINPPSSLPGSRSCGFYGLSIDQEVIALDREDLSNDLPIVSGIEIQSEDQRLNQRPKPYHRWANPKVEKALEFYKTVTAIDPTSVELLAEISIDDTYNLILHLLPGIKVMMGQGDFEKKWRRVRAILGEEERIEELVCLDLRFDDQVVLARSFERPFSRKR